MSAHSRAAVASNPCQTDENDGTQVVSFTPMKLEISGEQYALFAVFCIVNYLISMFFLPPEKSPYTWTMVMRLMAPNFCVLLLFFNLLPKPIHKFYMKFWYFTLFYCLPYLSALLSIAYPDSKFWFAGLCLSPFLLATLLYWERFLMLFILGILCAIVTVYLIEGASALKSYNLYTLVYICGFYITVGIVFARKKEAQNLKTIESLRSLSATIAHEMRTPLATISIASQTFNSYMGQLIKAYKKHNNHCEKPQNIIEPRILSYLESAPEDLYNISRRNLFLIEMLLKQFKGTDNTLKLKPCSMSEVIRKSLSEYSFEREDKKLIDISRVKDFKFLGDETLLMHVIFNLLSNSIKQIQKNQSGKIFIWTSQDNDKNILHFYDNAGGIPKHVLPGIFSQFYSYKKKDGTGIGLSFCHEVLSKFKAEIQCRSDGETFTEFLIYFKALKSS